VTPAFLDTSYLLAVEISNDQYHRQAQAHWAGVRLVRPRSLVTTTFVLNEVITYLNSRTLHAKAVGVGSYLMQSAAIELLPVDGPLWDAGWSYFQKHSDKTYSLTDCISFVAMEQRAIRTAFTFDHHFRQAGFNVEP
jgi:predicted nucleic acid-binding protein